MVYSVWLTWWRDDVLRFDLSTNRASFDNLKSLRLGLLARQYALSTDVTPDERQRYKARIESSDYSDGNQRRAAQIEGEYRLRTHPEVWVGAKHYRFQFSQQLDNGYFNPRTFNATHVTARLVLAAGRRRQPLGPCCARRAGPGKRRARRVQAGLRPQPGIGLAVRPQDTAGSSGPTFSSRTTGLSGFARNSIGVFLEKTW